MFKKLTMLTAVTALCAQSAYAGSAEAEKWINSEFQPSSLSKTDQMKEMNFDIKVSLACREHAAPRLEKCFSV